MNQWLLMALTACLSTASAANYFYCPKNVKYVYLGNTIDQVKQACDEPTSTKQSDYTPQQTQTITRWTYDYQPNAATKAGFTGAQQPKMKSKSLVVDFTSGKVASITVEGQPANKTNFCRSDLSFSVGSSPQFVYQLCKQPTLKQTIQQSAQTDTQKQTVLTYQNGVTSVTTLTFRNDKLISIN